MNWASSGTKFGGCQFLLEIYVPDSVYIVDFADGSKKEIFMSFGLMNAITRIVGDVDNVAALATDYDARDRVLVELLSERTKSGKMTEKVDLEELPLTYDEVVKIMTWAQEHMVDFFIKSLTGVKDLATKNKDRITDLVSFLTGSTTSPSATPSAGP